jgi:hypothetical protein
MNESEESLKGILHYVLVMSLNLLRSLKIEDMHQATCKAIQFSILEDIFLFNKFLNQPEVAASCPDIGINLHLPVHFIDSIRVRPHANIDQKEELWVELLAKTINEPVMGIKLSCLFVFDTEK